MGIMTSNGSCIKYNGDLIPFMNLVEDILLILNIDYMILDVQYKNTKTIRIYVICQQLS